MRGALSPERLPASGRSGSIFSGTGALRIAVVAGLIVVGAVVLSQAFPSFESPVVDVRPTVSVSPSAPPTKTPQEPTQVELTGIHVAVFNGTGTDLLAANTAKKLQNRFGLVPDQVGDAPAPRAITGIYYDSPKDKDAAEYLAKRFFPDGVDVGPLPADAQVDKGVQIAIYLGDDYASTLGA